MSQEEFELSHSADPSDRASDEEIQGRTEAIRRMAANREKPPAGWDKENCSECEEPVPKGRLSLGLFRCVHCQQFIENQRKRGRSYGN